ncbi:beta-galactosidase [Nesterenkonia muleiensis]|uniref:beta-galactosidase n=1 Tax=Nesterenkonia muleiensis TaxID=2282648 RepID=UPI000E76F6BC|nr:beta-galactosidase [Nesterenkonia muleiensis]
MQWPHQVPGLAYGGDYNPEQWPQATREEDARLMREAGVNLVSVGIFSWAMLEPREGEYDWSWLDQTMDRLHAHQVQVALATATASPPPWLTHKHPEILPQTAEGTTLWPGSRQAYSVSSRVFRDYALRMTQAVAERYAGHSALALWHVDNEIGCHNSHDFSDDAARAFRRWLEKRYGSVEELNRAWGTAFWSQRYSSFEQILPPRAAPMFVNPTQQLDFHRYSSDELLSYFLEIKATLREITPDVPVTTNLMCTTRSKNMDYFAWAPEMDVIATDHYTIADDPLRHIELSFSADLTRGVAAGEPWMLMEHSTSAVNWQLRNRSKSPAEMIRDSLAHVARGADAVMFFQWRQAQAGAEKYHSAMVPHAGTDSEVWRTTVRLGEMLQQLAPVRGSRVSSPVALLFDYQAWWAAELDSHPVNELSYPDEVMRWYRALWKAGVTVDVVHPGTVLSGYRAVVVPCLYMVTDHDAAAIHAVAEQGASVLVSYFSGIVDVDDQVRLGGYPGAFTQLLGVRSEEFWPLQRGEECRLDDGSVARCWSEKTQVPDSGEGEAAQVVTSYAEGPLTGSPAVTRRTVGRGAGWYVGTQLDDAATSSLMEKLLLEAGISAELPSAPRGVEVVRRRGASSTGSEVTFLFVLNHTEAEVEVEASGRELLSDRAVTGQLTLAAGEVAVVREHA